MHGRNCLTWWARIERIRDAQVVYERVGRDQRPVTALQQVIEVRASAGKAEDAARHMISMAGTAGRTNGCDKGASRVLHSMSGGHDSLQDCCRGSAAPVAFRP